MKEKEIITKLQEGDDNAFEQLFNLYKNKALRTVYLITRNQNISEDIVQEAFVKCYTSIESLKNPEHFKTWFYRILTRTTWSYMDKERTLIPVEEIFEETEGNFKNFPLERLEEKEISSLLYQEILKLNPKLQTTLILYYYNEFSIKEISDIMNCFEGTVKSRLYTGRQRLKKNLLKHEDFIIPREVLTNEKK